MWLTRKIRSIGPDEDGSGTIFSLFICILILMFGGFALDVAQAFRVRTILQVTADAAAYRGVVELSEPLDALGALPSAAAKKAAEANARTALSFTHLTNALHPDSVEIGRLDPVTRRFTTGAVPANAVRVRLSRQDKYGNPESTFLLRLLGIDRWNLGAEAIATVYNPKSLECVNPLLSLKSKADVGAQNAFLGICLYANAQIQYGDSIAWKNAKTDGLIDGLLAESLGLNMASTSTSSTSSIIPLTGLLGGSSTTSGSGATSTTQTWPVRDLTSSMSDAMQTADTVLNSFGFDVSQLKPGHSYRILCDDLAVIDIPSGSILQGIAVYSDCPIKFGPSVTIRSSLVISNLKSLFDGLGPLSVTPDISITSTTNCAPGSGVRAYLFLDLDAAQSIPALVNSKSPIGQYIQKLYSGVGGVLGPTLNTLGALTSELASTISTQTDALGLAQVCLAANVMLDADTIALR